MNARDDAAMQALSDAGAQCGVCGDQPGDRICPDCERCYETYVEALRKAGWAPRTEVLHEAEARLRTQAESLRSINCLEGPQVFKQAATHVDHAADDLRRLANEATS